MRLSETDEIQSAFRQEMQALFQEAGTDISLVSFMMPPSAGIIDGNALLKAYDSLQPDTFQNLGLKSEQVQVLKSLTFLLGQSARLEATPTNLKITLPLFHPVKPTTPIVAEAMDEVIAEFVKSIGPKKKGSIAPSKVEKMAFWLFISSAACWFLFGRLEIFFKPQNLSQEGMYFATRSTASRCAPSTMCP